MPVDLALDLQVATREAPVPAKGDLARWAAAALEGRRERAELTIRVVGREEGRALNLRYRGADRPTNVLSFPFEAPIGIDPRGPVRDLLGDLVICAAVVQEEARDQGKAGGAHWAHLVVHGVLHLIDFNHETDVEAAEMEALETVIIQGLGFPPPYEEDPSDP